MSKYAFETIPTLVFAIKWGGDNWDEMRDFLRDHTDGWTGSIYSTYQPQVLVERHRGGSDFVLEPGEWLVVLPEVNDGRICRSSDLIKDYRKKIIL